VGNRTRQDKPRAFNDPDVFETDADVAEFDKLFEQEKAKLEKDAGKKKSPSAETKQRNKPKC
jgi:hypothetical protein